MREITWNLATQRGVAYNATFPFEEMQAYLDFMTRYKQFSFKRVHDYNSARIKFLNMPIGKNAMQTDISKFVCKISSTFNFRRYSFACCLFTCHEFFHMAGGPKHLTKPHIMAEDGGSVGNFTVSDYVYLRAYKDKSTLRPWHEPNAMRDTFTSKGQPFESVVMPESFKCSCEDKRRRVYSNAQMEVP